MGSFFMPDIRQWLSHAQRHNREQSRGHAAP